MKKLRVGIVGAGNIARGAHLPVYQRLTDLAEVAAIADIVPERAQEAAETFGIPHVYNSAEAMLAGEPDLDYVDICVWTAAHAPVAIAAAKAGKHILCEKPLTVSLEQGRAMEAAVKEAGVQFMLAVCTRYGAEQQKAAELLQEGRFGEIYYAKTAYNRRRGVPGGWFTDKAYSGGGPVLDIAVHAIDRTWYLMGRPTPVSVSAETSCRIGDHHTRGIEKWEPYGKGSGLFNIEDSAAIFFRFEGGKVMTAETSYILNGPDYSTTQLYGTKAGCTFEPLTVYGEDAEGYLSTEEIKTVPNDYYEEEIRHFIDCIRTGKQPISPIEDALTVQKMLDGVYRSAALHQEVRL